MDDVAFLFDPAPDMADAPRAGFYRHRRIGRVDRPVRIWFGPPLDPETGEEMDRSPRWQIMLTGAVLEFDRWNLVWPSCQSDPIPQAEYDYLLARAATSDPTDPFGSDTGRIDPLQAALPF